jgi:hypothetical protein
MLRQPDATLDLELLSPDAGGPSIATPETFLGCPLGLDGEFFDCRLDFSDIGPMTPGERAQYR